MSLLYRFQLLLSTCQRPFFAAFSDEVISSVHCLLVASCHSASFVLLVLLFCLCLILGILLYTHLSVGIVISCLPCRYFLLHP